MKLCNMRWETVWREGICEEETRELWRKEVIMRQAISILTLQLDAYRAHLV
jgi:hypothetical protein